MNLVGGATYSGDPASSDRDWVRFRIGDTDTRDFLLGDDEIDAMLAEQSANRWLAAAECCEHIAARLAREADISTGGPGQQNRALSQRSVAYAKAAARLRLRASAQATPYCGGISIADKETERDDDDRPADVFAVDQFDHPDAGTRLSTDTDT